jgi:hypothetical protein
MPIITNFEDKVLQLIRSNQYQWFTVGVNLGGTSGESGGSGVPLGGFVGQLIQSKVTFDTSETISLDIPASGQSLVHNLNRIRYWINQRGLPIAVQNEGAEVVSGVTILDFVGAPVDVTYSGGKAIVTISGTGGGGSDTVKVSSDDTVANYLDDKITVALPITKTVNSPGGNEDLEIGFNGDLDDLSDVSIITAVSGEVLAYTDEWLNLSLAAAGISAVGHSHTESDITDLEHDAVELRTRTISTDAPSDGDAYRWRAGVSEWVPSGVAGGGTDTKQVKVSSNDTAEGYLEDKVVAGTNVTVTVLNEGSNETLSIASTASGGGGGDAVDAYDEGISIASGITSLDWTGSQIEATASGTAVTITVSGIMVDAPDFVGVRTYKTTNETWPAGQGWRNVDFGAENYDSDNMWSIGAGHDTPTTGYYHTYAQVTFSGGLSTTNALQLGLFRDSFPIAMGYRGYHNSADEIATYIVATDYYYTAGQDAVLKLVVHDGSDQPVLMSGMANTFMCTHQIQAVVASVEETPVACNVYATGYDTDPADDTWTEMRFDAERHDTDTMYTFGTSDTDININTAGYYNIKLQLMWHGLNETPFPIAQRIVLNGSTVLAQSYDMSVNNGGARAEGCSLISGCDYNLSASDVITAEVWHNRGSTLNDAIRPGDGSSFITLHRIGPT